MRRAAGCGDGGQVPEDSARTGAVAIVTDSTADIDPHVASERHIAVVPLTVAFGDETFPDGVLTQRQFFDRMKAAPELPTTSQPPSGLFAETYRRALETAEGVVSVHISSRLSGTIDSARYAAEQFGGRVRVFDSRNLSWGLGWQVLEAAEAAAEGLDADAVLARLSHLRDRVRLIVGLDSLGNLARGGRIGRVSAFLGAVLDLKVTFMVGPNGEFVPLGRNRGERAALRYTLDWVAEQMGDATRGRFAVGHALSMERAHLLADELSMRYEATDMVVYEAGSVISTHTGTGWGVAFVPEDGERPLSRQRFVRKVH